VPLLKMGNLLWDEFALNEVEHLDSSRCPPGLHLRPGDLLFNTRNSPELVGKTAVWRGQISPAVFDNNILRLRLHDAANPFFIGAWMASRAGRSAIRALASASTSVGAVYWRDLKQLLVPLLPRVA